MKSSLARKLILVILCLAVHTSVSAGTVLTIGSGWTPDQINWRWVDSGKTTPVQNGDASNATRDFGGWDFTLGIVGYLSITDGIDRDSYYIEVLNTDTNTHVHKGITSPIVGSPAFGSPGWLTGNGTYPDPWPDGSYHGLSLLLDPGSYNLKIWLDTLDFDSPADGKNKVNVAGAAVRLDPVPLPQSAVLLLFGLASLVGMGFRVKS